MRKIFLQVYVAVFCCILLTPLAVVLSGKQDPLPFFEKRGLAECPELNVALLDPFPAKFERYFNDHFPYRNSSIQLLNYVDLRYFGKSPVPSEIIVGTDGWLFSGTKDMEFLLGQQPLTDSMITAMIAELNDRYEKCRSIGAEYRLVILPSKVSLYPEHLPLTYRFTKWQFPMEAFMKRCSAECKAPVLYLLDSLRAHKDEQELFYHYDSHWNDAGYYYGYRSIMSWVLTGSDRRQLLDVDLSKPKEALTLPGNYTEMLGMQADQHELFRVPDCPGDSVVHDRAKEGYPCRAGFGYCDQYELAYRNTDTTLPGLVVVHDSYTNSNMQRMIAAHFGRSTFIWDYWEHKLNKEILAKEKPDLVLCIMCENFLPNLLKFPNRSETT